MDTDVVIGFSSDRDVDLIGSGFKDRGESCMLNNTSDAFCESKSDEIDAADRRLAPLPYECNTSQNNNVKKRHAENR